MARMKKSGTFAISAEVPISAAKIADSLSHDEVYDLIVQLDERMQDWDFTERLYRRFLRLHKKFQEENRHSKET